MSLIPTYGFRGNEAKLFNLRPGEQLPPGWSDRPAEAPMERSASAAATSDARSLENEQLRQENARLRDELEGLQAKIAELEKEIAELLAKPAGPDIDELRERAEKLGIQVNPRWGIAKLQRLIEEAENDSNKPHGE